jgi:hypothetical protein
MDSLRFDDLVRTLARRPSRRQVVRLLTGSALGTVLLSRQGEREVARAHDASRRCKRIDDPRRRRRCRRKAQRHDRNHPGEPCPACPAGQHCLANGGCALPCSGAGRGSCPDACLCADANAEGQRYCIFSNTTCDVHTRCEQTANCPANEQCADCGGNGHCLTLCLA